ncbi:MAG: putative toxin-antitoxin system toxin component, PIN family [Acidobacteria bacterium]|nr:putative toxin-antitoxin system toxin component, PIN family [Acidobacteriota bacterium]
MRPIELRIVLDTNFLIRAHREFESLASRLHGALVRDGHQILVSNELLSEISRVMRYPKLQRMYGLSDAELYEYIQHLRITSELVHLDPLYLAPMRDPSDLIILQTAERGSASTLCTSDRDFSSPEVIAYCASRGIEIVDEQTLASRLL